MVDERHREYWSMERSSITRYLIGVFVVGYIAGMGTGAMVAAALWYYHLR
jgi:hypothetical protein